MKCTARNGKGHRCGADAMHGSRRCFWHSPATTRAAREARRRGGENRMLALREPFVPTVVAAGSTALERTAQAEPPAWAKLEKRAEVLDAIRDIGRATLARRLDPRSANAALQAMQMLIAADDARLADKRARRQWAREQLRDRLAQLVEEVRHVKNSTDVDRLANFVEYITELAARARI